MGRERCDVLIIGGGPAGSSCAFGLRNSGLDVVVLDRETFPCDKVCAGWITPQILEELSIEPEHYRKERVLQPIRGFRVSRAGDAEALADFDEIVSYGIRRCEFDHYLLERCGARLRLAEPVVEIARTREGWVVNGAIEARVLVGAGGHFCPVARALGVETGQGEPAVLAREIEFEMSPSQLERCGTVPEIPELFFERDLRGYGWVVRKGDWLNVGLGRQDPTALSRHVDAFLDFLDERGRIPPDFPRKLKGHAYLLYHQAPRPLTGQSVLLVGDAAGLAYGRSGEGIRPAVESGLLAARRLREGGERPDADALARYAADLALRFGERESGARGLTDYLPPAWRGPVAARCLANPWFARKVVVERWFLHRHVPLLAA